MELVDRELAWLSFNSRVLEQAEDTKIPALERLRFLSIFQSNLDEFFMKRLAVPRAKMLLHQNLIQKERVLSINEIVTDHFKRAKKCYESLKENSLAKSGIYFLKWEDLTAIEKKEFKKYFKENVLPVLTPLAVDPGHPFPHISSLSTSIAVKMTEPKKERPLFARVKIPKILPSYLKVERDPHFFHWISTIELVSAHLEELFPEMIIEASMLFRITRNIEFEREEEEAEDLLEMISNELKERKFGHTVKLQCQPKPNKWLLKFIKDELNIKDFDIYETGTIVDYTDLNIIHKHGPKNLKFSKWVPITNTQFVGETDQIFENLRKEDILLHHPYESFKYSIEKVIIEAANDPKVRGIKLSLYRTNKDSNLIKALMKAVDNGKEVVCVIELKARLDEQNNISWAQVLEQAGVHIIYGVIGLKTHCKIALITRQEEKGLKCYAHIGTGNYNADTAAFYTDLGLITTDKKITEDVVSVFHFLTGRSLKKKYNKLLVAPLNLREKFLSLIDNEIKNHEKGFPAEIILKLNNLEDKKISEALAKASAAGVPISLGVRSICVFKPQPESKNLKIHSIVDQFLEHSRVFYFRNAEKERADGLFYMGSADLMTRNLDRRVEVLTLVENEGHRNHLLNMLDLFFKDNTQSWKMKSDGQYERIQRNTKKAVNFQLELRRLFLEK